MKDINMKMKNISIKETTSFISSLTKLMKSKKMEGKTIQKSIEEGFLFIQKLQKLLNDIKRKGYDEGYNEGINEKIKTLSKN